MCNARATGSQPQGLLAAEEAGDGFWFWSRLLHG